MAIVEPQINKISLPNLQAKKGISFARRTYLPRIIGLSLGAFPVASVLYAQQHHLLTWLALFLCSFVWPHVAHVVSLKANKPHKLAFLCLLIDSVIVGFWLPVIHFSIIPCILYITASTLNNVASGGLLFYLKGLLANIVGVALGIICYGFNWDIETSKLTILICLPLLLIYPLMVGSVTYHLSKKLGQKIKKIEKINQLDYLSQLYNRRFWESLAEKSYLEFKQTNQPTCLLMIDIDHFKKINDQFGHLAGDQVIQQFSTKLRSFFAVQTSAFGRYGGEEFGVILQNTDQAAALMLAQEFREKIAAEAIEFKGQFFNYTISIGVAEINKNMNQYWLWVDAADKALYQAKTSGRNQVCVYTQAS